MSGASATRSAGRPRRGPLAPAALLRALVVALCLLRPPATASAEAAAGPSGAASEPGVPSPGAASAEDPQPPHAFRHQEHYSHRIEQAVNDFKRAQQQQLQQRAANRSAAGGDVWERFDVGPLERTSSNDVDGDGGPDDWSQQPQHHRRHEQQHQKHQQHYQQSRREPQQEQQQQHHLRHHNRHHETWEQRVFPALRHQRHQQSQLQPRPGPAAASTTPSSHPPGAANEPGSELEEAAPTLNVTRALQTRLFDRDGLYSHAPGPASASASAAWNPHTTRGPRSRHHYGNVYEAAPRLGDRAFGDEAASREDSAELNRLESGRRFSLNLHAGNEESKKKPAVDTDEAEADEDDYEYEDEDEVEDEEHGKGSRANEFPVASANQAKVAVKRYSNPFRSHRPAPVATVRHFETAYDDGGELETPGRRSSGGTDSAELDDEEDEDDVDADFPSEKWNRIEHVHHLRQQQHQRELQRRLHGSSSTSSNNKYSASSPATSAAAGGRRPNRNDDEAEGIFARNYIPGTLTRQKQDELGTLEAVKESRRQHQTRHMQNKALANAHAKQIFSEASCRVPQRRVERIQRDPTKIYTPHCTVLHRCGDDTGCCKSDRQTCAPKRTKSVDLYFFVKSINDKRGSIERLTFVNHTECHCVEKSKHQPAEYGGAPQFGGAGAVGGPVLRRATILNCNCPRLYEKILQEDGFCRCDCSSGNTGCDWLKRGMEHFSMMDRKCILEGRCKPPTCEYGAYIRKHGRCPRREEQLAATLGGPALVFATGAHANSLRARSHH